MWDPNPEIRPDITQPYVIRFSEPIRAISTAKTTIVNNPNEPHSIISTLEQNEEVLAIGTTANFRWLQL